ADDEGDRHGLAQGAAQSEHDAADDAGPGVRQHHAADHLPGGAAQAVGGLLQHRRHGFEHVAGDRGDVRQHHDAEDDAGGEHADAVGRPGEHPGQYRHAGEQLDQQRLDVFLQERRQHEQAPDAVDDAGDAGEQLDRGADRALQPARAQLGDEDGDAHADRDADEHGDQGGDHGAVDRRQRAEFLGDRVPSLGDEEAEAESLEGGQRTVDQRNDDAAEQQQHGEGGGAGGVAQHRIPDAVPAQGV